MQGLLWRLNFSDELPRSQDLSVYPVPFRLLDRYLIRRHKFVVPLIHDLCRISLEGKFEQANAIIGQELGGYRSACKVRKFLLAA